MFGESSSLWELEQDATDAMPKGPTFDAKSSLIISAARREIYHVENGKKRLITSPDVFNRYAFDRDRVVIRMQKLGSIRMNRTSDEPRRAEIWFRGARISCARQGVDHVAKSTYLLDTYLSTYWREQK